MPRSGGRASRWTGWLRADPEHGINPVPAATDGAPSSATSPSARVPFSDVRCYALDSALPWVVSGDNTSYSVVMVTALGCLSILNCLLTGGSCRSRGYNRPAGRFLEGMERSSVLRIERRSQCAFLEPPRQHAHGGALPDRSDNAAAHSATPSLGRTLAHRQ